ncbi:hypothetical protein [Pantoea sp. R13S299]|uniref:hypothetical protein n=1 Tax=Pantoea sp. R13S299 TaxID=3402751 RepID=UPI003AE57AE5
MSVKLPHRTYCRQEKETDGRQERASAALQRKEPEEEKAWFITCITSAYARGTWKTTWVKARPESDRRDANRGVILTAAIEAAAFYTVYGPKKQKDNPGIAWSVSKLCR